LYRDHYEPADSHALREAHSSTAFVLAQRSQESE
jgi:hypothetical protein